MATEPWAIALTLAAVVFGSIGPILLKKGADHLSLSLKSITHNKSLLWGLFIYGTGTIVYLIALRGGDLSVLYPLLSAGYPLVALLSVYFLGERMNAIKWIGIASIITGVVLISIA